MGTQLKDNQLFVDLENKIYRTSDYKKMTIDVQSPDLVRLLLSKNAINENDKLKITLELQKNLKPKVIISGVSLEKTLLDTLETKLLELVTIFTGLDFKRELEGLAIDSENGKLTAIDEDGNKDIQSKQISINGNMINVITKKEVGTIYEQYELTNYVGLKNKKIIKNVLIKKYEGLQEIMIEMKLTYTTINGNIIPSALVSNISHKIMSNNGKNAPVRTFQEKFRFTTKIDM